MSRTVAPRGWLRSSGTTKEPQRVLASAFAGIAGQAAGSKRGTVGTPAAADCRTEATETNNNVESARVMLKRHTLYSCRVVPIGVIEREAFPSPDLRRAFERRRQPPHDLQRLPSRHLDRIALRKQHKPMCPRLAIELEVFQRDPVLGRRDEGADIQSVRIAPALAGDLPERIDVALEAGGPARDRHPSIVGAHDALERLGSARAEQYRRAGFLDRLGIASDRGELHQLALIAGLRLSP